MYKLVTQIKNLPIGTKVTKITGHVEYIIMDQITIYSENKKQIIPAEEGCLFLLRADDPTNSINAVSDTKEMLCVDKYINEQIADLFDEDRQYG